MPVDYSKWDALEVSDDSDIEVHPNVDKRSFIRAKQNQIHQQRFERKHKIETFKYERIVNDGLLARIDALLKSLQSHEKEIEKKNDSRDAVEVVFESLMEVTTDRSLGNDKPPKPPTGVHSKEAEISYGQMMGALMDQVKGEVEEKKVTGTLNLLKAYIEAIAGHHQKVVDLQKNLEVELTTLEKEEASKITSESIHTGFDSSHVSKATPTASNVTSTVSSRQPELLNPQSSGSEADIEDSALQPAPGEDDEDIEASAVAKEFGKLKIGDYRNSIAFISNNPEILAERQTDGLLAEAFSAQLGAKSKKEEAYARQCVHQALLLQYCRQLGKDGVGLFFKRVQTPGHQAQRLFLDDVNTTYDRIRTRTAELVKQQQEEEAKGAAQGTEQIQLHAVDPNTTINIVTPPLREQCHTDEEKSSRDIFETFPPGLRRALESGSLDQVNEVLGKMSVEEAESIVEQLSDGGMLSLEDGIIDATTEEGKLQMEEIERTRKMPGEVRDEEEGLAVDEVD